MGISMTLMAAAVAIAHAEAAASPADPCGLERSMGLALPQTERNEVTSTIGGKKSWSG